MAAIAQILQEVDSANAFFENRTSSQPGNDVTLKDNFTKTIIKQINACKASGKAEAIGVQDKIKHKSPNGPGLVRIQSAIDAKFGDSTNDSEKKGIIQQQKLQSHWKWYTAED